MLKKSPKDLHNNNFTLSSKSISATAAKNKNLILIVIPLLQNFCVNYALKMSMTMIMQFYVISVKHGSTLNVTMLIILITNIYKVATNHGISFTTMLFPFGNLNNQKFLGFINNNNNNNNNNESKNSNSSLILKPPPDLALLCNQFNNAIPENNSDPENVMESKYYDIDQLQQLKIHYKEKSLSFFPDKIPAH